jgi:hypothetical protein
LTGVVVASLVAVVVVVVVLLLASSGGCCSYSRPPLWTLLSDLFGHFDSFVQSVQKGPKEVSKVSKGPTAVVINFGERPSQKFFTRKPLALM